jgi:hypothetical protein
MNLAGLFCEERAVNAVWMNNDFNGASRGCEEPA